MKAEMWGGEDSNGSQFPHFPTSLTAVVADWNAFNYIQQLQPLHICSSDHIASTNVNAFSSKKVEAPATEEKNYGLEGGNLGTDMPCSQQKIM